MESEREPMNGPTERTYILEDASNFQQHHEEKVKGSQLSSQLPEFQVPDESQDSGEPRLTQGAFPAVPDADDPKAEKSSLALASFNYINSIVGSGVIGMPYALKQSGFGMGVLLLLGVGIVTDYSQVLLVEAGNIAGVTTYQDLVHQTYGKPGLIIQSLIQFLYPFIGLISYNIIVGDTLTKVLIRLTGISPLSVVVKREFIITTVTLLITLPLSLYRNIARLAKISLVSVLIVVMVAFSMLFRVYTMKEIVLRCGQCRNTVSVDQSSGKPSSASSEDEATRGSDLTLSRRSPSSYGANSLFHSREPTPDAWTFANPNIPSAIGIMASAFMCHHATFLVYESLQDNVQPRWNKVTHASIGSAVILIAVFAIAGYVTFTEYCQGDVFENYCWDDDLMNLCRGCYAITILLTYPIECFVVREVLEKIFFSQYQPQPFFRHATLTVIIALLTFLLSLTTDCLAIVLQVNGILVALPLAYIIPPMCYIRVKEGPVFSRAKYGAWGVTLTGLVTMIIGTVTLILYYDQLSECSHGREMEYCHVSDNVTITTPTT